jgi:hypothetical protein
MIVSHSARKYGKDETGLLLQCVEFLINQINRVSGQQDIEHEMVLKILTSRCNGTGEPSRPPVR